MNNRSTPRSVYKYNISDETLCGAGLTFGCIPWVKALLYGNNPPLGFVMDALETLGGRV